MNENQLKWVSRITWIILIVGFYLAVMWPFGTGPSEHCIFQQGFECEGGVAQIYVDDSNNLFVAATVHNKFGQTLENVEVICTNIGKGDVDSELFSATSPVVIDKVESNSSFEATHVPCVDSEGNQLKSTGGASFKGVLAISYSFASDTVENEKHIATGSLSGTIVK